MPRLRPFTLNWGLKTKMAPRALLVIALVAVSWPCEARLARSAAVVREWRQTHPCPANGLKTGPCPGWQVDHRWPLCAGGLDRPDWLQWLTVADHRTKTRLDLKGCRILRR